MKALVRTVIAICVVALLIASFRYSQHWLAIHTGTLNEAGPYYGFWSGFGSDLGEGTIVIGILSMFRHHNCHHPWCPFLGRPIEGVDHLVACWRHHPAHEGGRSVHADEMHRLYHAAKRVIEKEHTQ